jgi:nicotinamide-nucleotide amidase
MADIQIRAAGRDVRQAPDASLRELAQMALDTIGQNGLSIVTAESCTAGKLAVLLSEAPGAADHLHGGFVAYTKANQARALGVSTQLLHSRGAVCREVAVAMAEGALARTPADFAVAITGVAGPEPDEDRNPVGLVCIAVAQKGRKPTSVEKRYGEGSREQIQQRSMADALGLLLAEAGHHGAGSGN